MNPNFQHSFHLKSDQHDFPQSEQCYKNKNNFSFDIDIMKTYSLSNPKVCIDRCNTYQTQGDVVKQECNLTNPLIQNQQIESEFQINVDNILQFNQNLNGSDFIDLNKEIKSNSEISQKEDLRLCNQSERNYQSHKTELIVLPTPSYKNKLKAVGNMFLGIWRLQQTIVEPITCTDQFDDNLGSQQRNFNNKNNYKQIHPANESQDQRLMDIFNQFKLVCLFTQYSMSGSNEDIQNMIKILQRDPKRNLTNPQDPNHIINSLNQYGQNALYIASKNGNVEVVKFLLSLECNTHIKSRIFQDVTESPLEVSSRWHHLECVRQLLKADRYSNSELRSAIKVTQNQEIINLLKSNMNSSLFSCCL
ncbi:unnamed protein product [Paramecium sonneborni]|uniref:Ankyrin repeat protein n=1 Tax=Paramecium sonneborni TaxID=65129 RepID=A0A8S1RIL4_9CILI|nr:unnamed protein product [Paramecium sonneborni]